MTIEKLKRFPQEPQPQPETPRCDANVSVITEHEKRWRAQRYDQAVDQPFRCSRSSVVKIRGKCYCRLHGGHVALDMVISGDLIEAGL